MKPHKHDKRNGRTTYVRPPWKGTAPGDILERIEISQERRVLNALNGQDFLTAGKDRQLIIDGGRRVVSPLIPPAIPALPFISTTKTLRTRSNIIDTEML